MYGKTDFSYGTTVEFDPKTKTITLHSDIYCYTELKANRWLKAAGVTTSEFNIERKKEPGEILTIITKK